MAYWELYPAEDGDIDRFKMADTDKLLTGIAAALLAVEKADE